MREHADQPQLIPQWTKLPKGERWEGRKRPIILANGRSYSWKTGESYTDREVAVVSCNEKNIEGVCGSLSAEIVTFYDMRVRDLSVLAEIKGLRRLVIDWNTKAVSLAPLAALKDLEVLSLTHTPKVTDLAPIAKIDGLRSFEFEGGNTVSSPNTADSLEPIGELDRLEELALSNLTVRHGGLRPIALCRSLKRLALPINFLTEDYAFLAAKLPDTKCRCFAGVIELDQWSFDINGRPIKQKPDTMIVGRRKPILHSVRDAERIQKYRAQFEALKAEFAAG